MKTKIYHFDDWLTWLNINHIPVDIKHVDFKEHYQNLESFENNYKNFMKLLINELIKEYNLIQEFENNQDIINKYNTGDLCSETDEKYSGGFWDLSGDIATEKQEYIFYAFQELLELSNKK